jgi:hypothetical protein
LIHGIILNTEFPDISYSFADCSADPQMPVQSETTEIKYESNEVITETSEAIHMNGGGNQVYINTPSISN